MKPIIRAILNSDLVEVRKLITSDEKASKAKSESGRTPVQLAYAAGNFPICAALLRHAQHGIDEIPISERELLENLIADFSQSTLCSGWNRDIEFELWALIVEDSNFESDYDGYLNVASEILDDIEWVALWADGWIHWPESEDAPSFVSMAEWKVQYQNRSKR